MDVVLLCEALLMCLSANVMNDACLPHLLEGPYVVARKQHQLLKASRPRKLERGAWRMEMEFCSPVWQDKEASTYTTALDVLVILAHCTGTTGWGGGAARDRAGAGRQSGRNSCP